MTSSHVARIARNAFRAIVVSLLAIAPAWAQTTSFTSGGVEVRAFLGRNATTMYAAAYGGGLWRTTTTGTSWSRVALPNNVHYLTSIDGNNTVMVIGAAEGLVRTTDFVTFTQVLSEPVEGVAVPAGASSIVLAAIKGVGIVRSTDAGVSFAAANNAGFDSLDVFAVAFDPSNANVAYAAAHPDASGNKGGVFRSTDGGVTWANFNANLPGDSSGNFPGSTGKWVASIATDSNGALYVGLLDSARQGDVYYRTAAGSTFTASGSLLGGVVSLHRDANTAAAMWAGSSILGLQKGTNGTGFSYQFAQTGAPNLFYTGINAVGTFPGNATNVVKAIKGAGVWISTAATNPRTWTRVDFTGAERVRALTGVTGQANTVLVGVHAGGVWKSTAGLGGPWSPPTVNAGQADFSFGAGATAVDPFTTIWELSASQQTANVIYAAAGGVSMNYTNDAPGVFRWNGSLWQGIGNSTAAAPWNIVNEAGMFMPNYQAYGVAVNILDETQAYLSLLTSGTGVRHRTTALGWSGTLGGSVRSVVTSPTQSTRMLALVFGDKPQLSTNGGDNFATVSVSQTGFDFLRFFSAAQNPLNANMWFAGSNKGLFRSNDAGASWSRVAMAGVFQNLAITAVGFRPNTQLAFAADFDGNRYCSNSGGAWTVLAGKLNAGVNGIRTVGSSLYYLTDGAGFVREDGTC